MDFYRINDVTGDLVYYLPVNSEHNILHGLKKIILLNIYLIQMKRQNIFFFKKKLNDELC